MKSKFSLKVNTENDIVLNVKAKVLLRLGLLKHDDASNVMQLSNHPKVEKMRVFCLKGGMELMDHDSLESVEGQTYLFYSLNGESFDFQVRMEFIHFKKKLGEGGFGSVYLAFDDTINDEVAVKVLNFS